jgi:hypothetical protein
MPDAIEKLILTLSAFILVSLVPSGVLAAEEGARLRKGQALAQPHLTLPLR